MLKTMITLARQCAALEKIGVELRAQRALVPRMFTLLGLLLEDVAVLETDGRAQLKPLRLALLQELHFLSCLVVEP